MTEASFLLEARDISFSYGGGREVFGNVSFGVAAGEVFAILGPNGVGKSTLLGCVAGLHRPSSGQVFVDGAPLTSYPRIQLAQRLGYVEQRTELAFDYRVEDYVVMGRAPYVGYTGRPTEEDRDASLACLERMGVAHLADRVYRELSGGERQQVDIARVLAQRPHVLILDEPTSALDFGNQAKVLQIVRDLATEGMAVVMTTHDPNHAIALDMRVGLLKPGGAWQVGSARDVLTSEALSAVYGTDVRVGTLPALGRPVCAPVI